LIEVRNINFKYGEGNDIFSLSDINLTFKEKNIYGIIGKNGSGKTTLLKIIVNILKNYKGEILVNGRNIKGFKRKELSKLISFLPQENLFFSNISVFYFLLLARYPYLNNLKGFLKSDYKIVENIMENFNLIELKDRYLNNLSGGEKKRVLFASLFITDSKYIILDEPDAFLDPPHIKEIKDSILKLKNSGKTIILTSHSINFITDLSDFIIGLKNGKLIHFEKNFSDKNNNLFENIFDFRFNTVREKDKVIYYI
jgi:ABC-type cobalamin/Fe3+-siderophores transport system ATPase subunit